MNVARTPLRPLVLIMALALAPLATACSPGTVSPLPVGPAAPSASAAIGGVVPATDRSSTAPQVQQTRVPVRPSVVRRTTEPAQPESGPSTCLGAERYDIDLSAELLEPALCFKTGGVLRLKGIGPGLVTVQPESLVSQNYAGGVVDVRLLRKGTVDVRIPLESGRVHTITVVIN
jgi:hypothetical protein